MSTLSRRQSAEPLSTGATSCSVGDEFCDAHQSRAFGCGYLAQRNLESGSDHRGKGLKQLRANTGELWDAPAVWREKPRRSTERIVLTPAL